MPGETPVLCGGGKQLEDGQPDQRGECWREKLEYAKDAAQGIHRIFIAFNSVSSPIDRIMHG